MAEERPTAGEADSAIKSGRDSAEAILHRLESALARVAQLSQRLPSGDDLFSPTVQSHQSERLARDYAELRVRHAVLSDEHQALRRAYDAMTKRQREAEKRLGAVMARVQAMIANPADGGE